MVSSPDPQDHKYEPDARPLLRPGGMYVAINGPLLDFVRAILSNRIGVNLHRRHYKLVDYQQRGEDLALLRDFAEQGNLRPVLAHEFRFTETGVAEAIAALRSRRVQGKVVLVMDETSPADAVSPSLAAAA